MSVVPLEIEAPIAIKAPARHDATIAFFFRRYSQVQLLIFLQTVTAERKGTPPLSPEQREAAETLRVRATELLSGVAPNGPAFAATLERLLQRENHWLDWKANGCPAFDRAAAEKRPRPADAQTSGAKRRAGAAGGRAKRVQLGNSELSRLWNLGDNSLAAIAAEGSKQAVPSLGDYLQPLIEQVRRIASALPQICVGRAAWCP